MELVDRRPPRPPTQAGRSRNHTPNRPTDKPRHQPKPAQPTNQTAETATIITGKRIQGKVVVTVSRGRVVWENGRLNVQPGTSRYVHLPTNGPLFEGLEKRDAAKLKFPLYGETPVVRGEKAEGEGGGKEGEREPLVVEEEEEVGKEEL